MTVEEVLDKWGLKLVNDLKTSIDAEVKHSGGQTSDLSGSVNYKTLRTSRGWTFNLTMNDYWYYFEHGRKAGKMPPTKPIRKWLEKKGISQAKANEILKLSLKTKIKFSKKLDMMSFAIAKSIAKKGTKPHPFIDRVINEERKNDLKVMLFEAFKDEFVLKLKE